MAVRPPRRTAAAPPHLSGIRRVAVRAVVLLLLLLVTAPVSPPALADGIASLTIDTVSPPVALAGQQVTVTGTVDNTGTTAIPAGQVIAQIDSRSLTTQGEMDAWFDQSTPADGAVVAQVDLPEVPPQGQAAFTLTIGQFSTGRTAAFGVVPLTISAAGVTTHTALGYQRIKEYQPLNVAVLVPVTITANAALVGPPGEARTTAWRTALQSGSRLDQLLPLLSRDGVQAAVDPTLLGVSVAPDGTAIAGLPAVIPPSPNAAPSTTPNASASATPGGTPSVSATPSSPTPSAAQSGSASTTPTPTPTLTAAPGTTLDETRVRAAFATKLTAALAGTDPFVLPVGDPDIAAILDADSAQTTERTRSLVAASRTGAELIDGQPDLLLPPDGGWSEPRAAGYRALLDGRSGVVVVNHAALPWRADGAAGRNADGLSVLSVDDRFGSFLRANVPMTGARQQWVVAASLATLLEAPGRDRDALVLVGHQSEPAMIGQGLDLLDQIPWLTTTTVSATVDTVAASPVDSQSVPPVGEQESAAGPVWLTAESATALSEVRQQAAVASSLRDDRALVGPDWANRADQLLSTRWRTTDPAGGTAPWEGWPGAVRTLTDEITASASGVSVAPQTISFLADRGRLQLTVVNQLTVPVTDIRIQLTSDSPRLVVEPTSAPFSIAPRSRATVTFDAVAYAAGPVQLQAGVLAPNGTAVGSPTNLEVSVSPTAQWVYWALGGLAVLIFLIGLLNSRRKKGRGRTSPIRPSATSPAAEPTTPETPNAAAPDTAAGIRPLAEEPHVGETLGDEILDEEFAEVTAPRTADGGSRGVARSSLIMAAGTLTSRLLGLLRATLLAGIVGLTGYTADAFGVANTLPNQFYLILAGGVFNAVLVPQIVKASSHKDGGEEFVSRLITLGMALLLVATIATTLAAPWLVDAFSTFKNADADRLAVLFAYLCIPQIFFYGLYTLLGQVLNARQHFGAYMWAPVVANVVALGGLLAFLALGFPRAAPPTDWSPAMIGVLAGSATLSIAMQALFLIIPLRRIGFRYRPVWGFRGVGLGTASTVALWSFGAVLVSQLGFVVTSNVLTEATDRARVTGVIAAGRGAFDNAFLLFMLPHSLITVSLVTALFTRMSSAVHESRISDLRADIGRGLRMPAVILIPGTVYGLVFAPVLTRAFFFNNQASQTNAVASVMVTLFIGVVPFGWLYLSERFFFAHSDARTPFRIQLVVTSLATLGALLASRLDVRFTAPGVGLGQSMAYAVGAGIGFLLIRRRIGRLGLAGVLTAYLRLLVPSLLAAGLLTVLVRVTVGDPVAQGPLFCAALAVGAGAVVLASALIGGSLLGVGEVRDLLDPLLRRLRRRPGPTT